MRAYVISDQHQAANGTVTADDVTDWAIAAPIRQQQNSLASCVTKDDRVYNILRNTLPNSIQLQKNSPINNKSIMSGQAKSEHESRRQRQKSTKIGLNNR